MHILQKDELSVAEIQEILGMGQSRISTHLARLKRSRLVQDRRAGKNIYYSWNLSGPIKEPELQNLVQLAVADMPQAVLDRSSLQHVIAKRKNRTREYFNRLAGKFGRSYCPGRSWQALAHLFLTMVPSIDVADLGAGEGTLSQILAKSARKVIALDISERMVEVGSQLAKDQGITNLEYRLGDLEDPPISDDSIDLAIFSQALHHASSPPKAIAAARRILRHGGRLVLLDLLAHGFEQARELYADLWLGFTEVELLHFLEQAGFRENEVQIVSREPNSPYFQTVLATGVK